MLTQKIIEKEFALSGSEQNPDTTSKSVRAVLEERLGSGPPSPVQAFMDHGEDFIVERSLPALVRRMNALAGEDLIDHAALEAQIVARDRQIANPYAKDGQVTAIHGARAYFADKVTRVAAPHRILDPEAGPLIAVRLLDPHPQVARRSADGPLLARAAARPASRCPGSTRPARWPASAAAACTATARWRGRSSAAACSPGGSPGAPRRPPPLRRAAPNIRRMGS